MTLVVARIAGERVAIVSDTAVTQFGLPLQNNNGIIKSCLLPGKVCASFSNSPDLAARAFSEYARLFPNGAGYSETVSFFKSSSSSTGNDYLLAFAEGLRLVKIADGEQVKGLANTQWIGDQLAYQRFREFEVKRRKNSEVGRALNAVLFADELTNSPASDLYSTLRNVVSDRSVPSTGGFVCVISNREDGFRHSVYSDTLYDWPKSQDENFILRYEDPIDMGASGENAGYALAQISTGFLGVNLVAFYLLKGRKLFLYYGEKNGLADKCLVLSRVEPGEINDRLNQFLGANYFWLLTIVSSTGLNPQTTYRSTPVPDGPKGLGLSFFCHANTFPNKRTA